MDSKTDKLLQQAGKYVQLGKLTLALEQYLKIQKVEPEDPTIINTIGDLYVRLDDKDNALGWYHKLAETFEHRELYSNAVATYRKILKLSPKNLEALACLARLHERQGQIQNAKAQYLVLARLLIDLGRHDQAITTHKKICELEPRCADSWLSLGQAQEHAGLVLAAGLSYLEGASMHAEQGNVMAAAQVADNIFRLKPKDKIFVKSFFSLLRKINLTSQGFDYLRSLSLDQDPDFKLFLSEMLLEQGRLEEAHRLVQSSVRQNPELYRPALEVLQGLIARGRVTASLDLVDEILQVCIRLKDEKTLKAQLDALLRLDETNIRLLRTLTTLLIRMNERSRQDRGVSEAVDGPGTAIWRDA